MHDLNPASHARILIVDDNRAIHNDMRKVLDGDSPSTDLAASAAALFGDAPEATWQPRYDIDSAFQGLEALERVRAAIAEKRPYAMAFVDMRMPPGWDGVETIERLWREDPDLQVCICTAFSDYSWSEITSRLKSNDRWLILKKPFDTIEVCQVAASLVEKRRLSEIANLRLQDLEQHVEARTALLNDANQRLRNEIADRIEAEEQLREREEQLSEAKRLEAVGKLAGGIAHEFNNLLQIITGYCQCAIEMIDPDSSLHTDLQQVLKTTSRAATLTNQLLGFSRRQVLRRTVLNPNVLMADFLELARPLFGERISVSASLDPDIRSIHADGDQLRQALLNLALNARDAMTGEGSIAVSTRNVFLDDEANHPYGNLPAGEYIELAISDSGHGIPAAIQSQVFEPFFTTKEVGKGTGLGLAMVHGTVQQHQGAIHFSSEEGRGTIFRILLPALAEQAPSTTTPGTDDATSARPTAGEAVTILVAEDDPQVRGILARTLKHGGYRVLEAEHGAAALEVFEKSPEIQLALLDVVMPRMDGWELFTRLRAQRPDLRVVFCTGYDPVGGPAAQVAGRGVPILRKPITRDSLLKAIQDALRQDPSALVASLEPELVASQA